MICRSPFEVGAEQEKKRREKGTRGIDWKDDAEETQWYTAAAATMEASKGGTRKCCTTKRPENSPSMALHLCQNTRVLLAGFRKYDVDGSQSLDRGEFRAMFDDVERMGHCSLGKVDGELLFDAFDRSGDGEIDYGEFTNTIYNTHNICKFNSLNIRQMPQRSRFPMSLRLGLETSAARRTDMFTPRINLPTIPDHAKPRELRSFRLDTRTKNEFSTWWMKKPPRALFYFTLFTLLCKQTFNSCNNVFKISEP